MAIFGYLGRGAAFDEAIAAFADRYADQNEADHKTLKKAVADGRVKAAKEATGRRSGGTARTRPLVRPSLVRSSAEMATVRPS